LSSGLDDNSLDAVLGDGIHGQTLQDNMCYQELSSESDLRKAVQNEKFIVSNKEAVITVDSILPNKSWLCFQRHYPLLDISIISERFILDIKKRPLK
jgi:hypothetical protein